MKRAAVYLRLFAGLIACAQCAGVRLPAEEAEPLVGRQSPRATLRTFLDAVHDAKSGQAERIADAIACMDFSRVAVIQRDEIILMLLTRVTTVRGAGRSASCTQKYRY
jgi:hypothetical protein